MGNFYMESTQINYRRDEKLKTVDQKLQELSETSAIDTDIAPVFKSTNTYQPGDMVYYRNKLYVFNVEHTGAWAAADVTATDVTTAMNAALSGKADYADLAGAFSAELSYSAGDLVIYNGIIYRCTNDHTGAWDADDFSATTIAAEIDSLKSGLTNLSTSYVNMHNGYYRVNVTGEGENKWYKIAEHTATAWDIDVSTIAIGGGSIKRLTLRYDQTEATFNNSLTKIDSVVGGTGRLAYKYSENKVEVFWKGQRYGINTYTVLSESGNTPVTFQTPVLTEYVDTDMDYIEPST